MVKKKKNTKPLKVANKSSQMRSAVIVALVFGVVGIGTLVSTFAGSNRVVVSKPIAASISGPYLLVARDNTAYNSGVVNSNVNVRFLVDGVPIVTSNECVSKAQYIPGEYYGCWDTASVSDGSRNVVAILTEPRKNGRGKVMAHQSLPVVFEVKNSSVANPQDPNVPGNTLRITSPTDGALIAGSVLIKTQLVAGTVGISESDVSAQVLTITANGTQITKAYDCASTTQYEPGMFYDCWNTTGLSPGRYILTAYTSSSTPGTVITSNSVVVEIR